MQAGASPIPIRNLWYLLLYAWDRAAFRGRWSADSEAAPSLPGLLARVLADLTASLLRKGLGRSYVHDAETIRGVRGRIDFATSLRRLTFENGQAHCQFDRFSTDTLRNQILRSTLHCLAEMPALRDGTPYAKNLRLRLGNLVRSLGGIAIIEVHDGLFDRLQTGRNDADYELIMNICRLLHRLMIPTQEQGPRAVAGLAELAMPKVFEDFVRNFYRAHFSDAYHIAREWLHFPDDYGCPLAPAMGTDVTLTSRGDGSRIVVECKFSINTLATSERGKEVFKSPNLYQLYAYLRSQEDRTPEHRGASGLLLYPTVHADLDECMHIQGHRIRVATVDLAAGWEAIEARLLSLISSWPDRAGAPTVTAAPATH